MVVSKQVYLRETLRQVPRLLGLLDRNILSKTYGCFDRPYWHYSASDFANARKQEAVLTLALLYNIKHKGNLYWKKPVILSFINASLGFWRSIQHGNGSFSEWYPNEYSFVATAFSGYAVSETLLQVKAGIEHRKEIISALERAADFVSNRYEKRASNQEAGCIAFLYNVFLLTGKKRFEARARKKARVLLESQSKEGWFPEYNGFDVGYHSLAIDYVAKYYEKSRDNLVLKPLKDAVGFLSFFAHPDGSFGGPYCSRNTEYIIPSGIEALLGKCPESIALARQVRCSIASHSMASLASLDDNYLCYNAYTYLQAFQSQEKPVKSFPGLALQKWEKPVKSFSGLAFQKKFTQLFPESGIFVKSGLGFYLVASVFKGGAFKLCKNRNSFEDFGLLAETSSGERLFSSAFSRENKAGANKGSFAVSGKLAFAPSRTISPAKSLLLRSFQLSFGLHPGISSAGREFLRRKLITKQRVSQIGFSRKFSFHKGSVSVRDSVKPASSLEKIFLGFNAAHIYVPSSNYFFATKAGNRTWRLGRQAIERKTEANEFRVKRSF